MTKPLITAHVIVRNEERFIWYAIKSVIDYVDKMLIFDTGSDDSTALIVESIKSKKIEFEQKGKVDRKELVRLRQEQVNRTKTDWCYVVDGDEVYSKKVIESVVSSIRKADKNKVGVYLPFYNLVGDIYHTQSERYGCYQIGERRGHINLRGIKKINGLKVVGEYPMEAYCDFSGKKIQDYDDKDLIYVDKPFYHAGSLSRSSMDGGVLERKKVYDLGISLTGKYLPEVFNIDIPKIVLSVTKKRDFKYTIVGFFISIIRFVKYILESLLKD